MSKLLKNWIIQWLILIVAINGVIWAFQSSRVSEVTYQTEPDLFVRARRVTTTTPEVVIMDNTIKSRKTPPTEPRTLAFLTGNRKYESLIDCLAFHESSNNPDAYNRWDPYTPSIGLLQYKKSTFRHYCVEKYELPNNIWSAEVQRECANLMLSNNFKNIYHWSTHEDCGIHGN